MPFISDKTPPVDAATLAAARTELPREYGTRVATQQGRKAFMVRVPRAKPDYNYELAKVAFYASLEELKDATDVLLVGDEKVVRMEPIRLRDHVREQMQEDRELALQMRARLDAEYGWMLNQSELNHQHHALVIRLPVPDMTHVDETLLLYARAAIGNEFTSALVKSQCVLLVTENDYARVGRRVFVEAVASDLADQLAVEESASADPLHLAYQTPGAFIKDRIA